LPVIWLISSIQKTSLFSFYFAGFSQIYSPLLPVTPPETIKVIISALLESRGLI